MTTLAAYLSDQKLSQKALAVRLGIDPSIVSRLVKDAMRPSLELAVKIERETDGAVPATSWIPSAVAATVAVDPEHERGAA